MLTRWLFRMFQGLFLFERRLDRIALGLDPGGLVLVLVAGLVLVVVAILLQAR